MIENPPLIQIFKFLVKPTSKLLPSVLLIWVKGGGSQTA